MIDSLAWQLMRVVFLLQYVGCLIAATIMANRGIRMSLKTSTDFMGLVLSSQELYQTTNPEGLPKIVRDKILLIGRMFLGMILIAFMQRIIREVV